MKTTGKRFVAIDIDHNSENDMPMRYGGRPSSVLDVTIKEGHAHELAKSIALSLLAGSVIGSITIDIFPAR